MSCTLEEIKALENKWYAGCLDSRCRDECQEALKRCKEVYVAVRPVFGKCFAPKTGTSIEDCERSYLWNARYRPAELKLEAVRRCSSYVRVNKNLEPLGPERTYCWEEEISP